MANLSIANHYWNLMKVNVITALDLGSHALLVNTHSMDSKTLLPATRHVTAVNSV